jgi:tetratricopeptide (TPR) repeat protein
MKTTALALSLLAASVRAPPQPSADDHMLAGARYFQTDRFNEALVEFRVAERLGEGGALWYAAATQVKLRLAENALEDFARAESIAPGDRDALLDYYHALACYDARLYSCADRLLGAVHDRAGPRVAEQVLKIRRDLRAVLLTPPPTATLDWYHERGRVALAARRFELASAFYEEARSLAALRSDRYRSAEAVTDLMTCRRQLRAGDRETVAVP